MNKYKKLGFKAGIEIHQQLDTKNKLFCRCPVGIIKRPHDSEIVRHMRPTLSELGEYDGTALMEFKTKKKITYRLYKDAVCTYSHASSFNKFRRLSVLGNLVEKISRDRLVSKGDCQDREESNQSKSER